MFLVEYQSCFPVPALPVKLHFLGTQAAAGQLDFEPGEAVSPSLSSKKRTKGRVLASCLCICLPRLTRSWTGGQQVTGFCALVLECHLQGVSRTLSNHSSNDYGKTKLTKKLWKQAQEIEMGSEGKAVEGGRDWRHR